MNTFNISYTWNIQNFTKATKALYDFNLKHSPKRFLGWIFIALTQFGVVGALKKDVYGLLIVSTLLVIYWYALRWPMRKAMLQRNFKSSQEQLFEIKADNNSLQLNEIKIEWSDIIEAISLQDGFVLYYADSYLFIPKDAFNSTDEKDNFSYLLKNKIKNYSKDT
jgi:hypothetical protein